MLGNINILETYITGLVQYKLYTLWTHVLVEISRRSETTIAQGSMDNCDGEESIDRSLDSLSRTKIDEERVFDFRFEDKFDSNFPFQFTLL